MKSDKLVWLGLMMVALNTSAQVIEDPQWQEIVAPPAPAFNTDRLIPIDMPSYVSLRLGIDPATIAIASDGVVRYVVVASNENGSINAMYEGIRCATGEVKTYARYTSSGQWSPVSGAPWRGLNDNLPSRHALALARNGVCEGRTAASSAAAIVNALKYPKPVH